ncbi:MAG TPA: glycosyltransferase [Chloroflexota bacterium]|nr:glycosyltransferase [Chloroflexota bacterium]
MRILFALNAFRPLIDGVGVSIERQSNALAERGHQIAILAPASRFADTVDTFPNYRLYRLRAIPLPHRRQRMPLLPGRGVTRALGEFRPDVVVVNQPFLLSRATWHAARARRIPLVGIISMMPEWFYYNVPTLRPLAGMIDLGVWRMMASYYNECNHVVGVTGTARDILVRHGLRVASSVISNGVPLHRFQPRVRDSQLAARFGVPDKPTVLYTGRLDAEKCMNVWIRAIPLVRARVDAHFVVGGEGSERAGLEDLAAELGVADAVSFIGFQPDSVYPRLFSVADVFAITSPAELQSVVTLEAVASGLPIVAARAGALPELVQDGENGRLVARDNPAALAAALVEILSDPERRRVMGLASRRLAAVHDFAASVDAYEAVYRAVAGGARSGLTPTAV